jgi:chromosome segregation ATPase
MTKRPPTQLVKDMAKALKQSEQDTIARLHKKIEELKSELAGVYNLWNQDGATGTKLSQVFANFASLNMKHRKLQDEFKQIEKKYELEMDTTKHLKKELADTMGIIYIAIACAVIIFIIWGILA